MGGGSELENRTDTFKTIVRHKMGYMHLSPTENIYDFFFLKPSDQFMPGFYVTKRQIPMNWRK